jgi:(2Fe-2S) ferredoxin
MSDKKYDAHLFICTNEKQGKPCCAAKSASELRDQLKKISKDPSRGWEGRVRVNNSGCLDRCQEGIAAVLYPQGEWFTNLKSTDVEVLVDAIETALNKD